VGKRGGTVVRRKEKKRGYKKVFRQEDQPLPVKGISFRRGDAKKRLQGGGGGKKGWWRVLDAKTWGGHAYGLLRKGEGGKGL